MALCFTKLLLIAGLVLCPFRCQLEVLSSVVSGDGNSAAAPCCCVGCQQRTAESPADTAPEHQNPTGDRCQCICSGAVVEKSNDDGLLDAAPAGDVLEPHTATLAQRESVGVVGEPAHARCGLNTGRILRTLHQSLLC